MWQCLEAFLAGDIGEGAEHLVGPREVAKHPTVHRTALPHAEQRPIRPRLRKAAQSNETDNVSEGSVTNVEAATVCFPSNQPLFPS